MLKYLLPALLLVSPVLAETMTNQSQITMRQGFVASWQSDKPFASASIGRTDIVDAIPQSDRVLLLTAKSAGVTNIVLFDERGAEVANLDVRIVGRDVNRVQIHSKIGNLHAYWAYECGSNYCARTADTLEGSDRIPVFPPIFVVPPLPPVVR